jgi:hypothetical protein
MHPFKKKNVEGRINEAQSFQRRTAAHTMGKKRQRSGREVTSSPEPPEPTIVLDASDDQDDDVDPRQTMIVDKAVERGNQRKAKRQKRSKSKTTGDDSGGGVAAGAVAPVAGGAGLPSAEVETKEEDALPTGVKIVVKPQRETTPERVRPPSISPFSCKKNVGTR